MSAALSCGHLNVRLGETPILHDVSLSIARGVWTSIVGPNGAGKSTLLRALAGLLPADGEILWDGRPLHALPRRQRARQLAWLGQGEGASDDLPVHDLVMLGRLPHQSWLATPSGDDQAAVRRALEVTQVWDFRHRPMANLSAGERQRVLLARALAVEADVLLMDEPLINLDPPHQADWLRLVRTLVRRGTTVVSVLHEIAMALHADDMVIIDQGRVCHHGACDDRATHSALASVFGHCFTIHAVEGQWVVLPAPARDPEDHHAG